jgi:hypothetical protein
MNQRIRDYPMHRAKSCGAKTRAGGKCRAPAMPNGRCRMHGGCSLAGAASPRFKHGLYTKEMAALRRWITALGAELKDTLCEATSVY